MNTTKIRKGAKERDIQHKKEICRDPMYNLYTQETHTNTELKAKVYIQRMQTVKRGKNIQ